MIIKTKKVLAGFGWVALAKYSNKVFGFLTTLILAKLLSPNDFGIVAIASMIIHILYTLKDMGIAQALIYQKDDLLSASVTAFWMMVILNTIILLVAILIAPYAADFYDNRIVMPVIIIMSTNLLWNAIRAVPSALIRKNIDFHKLVVPEVVPVAIASIVSILMAYHGYGVWSLVVRSMIVSILGMILIWFFTPFRPSFKFNIDSARELFRYGKYIVGSSLFFVALYNIDKFYVSKVGGIVLLGFYELAMRIANLPISEFSHLVGSVMFPVLSKMNQDLEVMARSFLKTLQYSSMISIPMAFGIATYGPVLIEYFYGEKWMPMAVPLQIISGYALFRSLSTIIHDTFKATGKPVLMQRFVIFRLLIIGILGVPALQFYKLEGMCALLAITYCVAFFFEAYTVSRLLKIRTLDVLRTIIFPISASIIIIPGSHYLIGSLFSLSMLNQIISAILISCAGYLLATYLLRKDIRREFKVLIFSRQS